MVPEICDDQLCTSNHNFSNNYSITNLYIASCWFPHWSWIWLLLPWTLSQLAASFFHNCATPHDRFRVVVHICTRPHDGFPVDVGSATMMNVIASCVLFHNCTMPHDCFRVADPNMTANSVMTTGTPMGWSVFLNYVLFDDILELWRPEKLGTLLVAHYP